MTATLKQARHLLKVVDEKNLSGDQLAELHDSGLLTDLLEVAKEDLLGGVDRTVYRHVLGLPSRLEDMEACLRLHGEVTIPAGAAYNPAQGLNRPGVWLSGVFESNILSVAKVVENVPETTLAGYNLAKPANDEEVCRELPKDHVFENAGEFCALLSAMMERQKSGEAGGLLANGYANIFYVRGKASEVFAVNVYWSGDDRAWHVSAARLDDCRWNAGARAFSRNC